MLGGSESVHFNAFQPQTSLFLPAAGYCEDKVLNEAGSAGRYRSRELYDADEYEHVYYLHIGESENRINNNSERMWGMPIRPLILIPE